MRDRLFCLSFRSEAEKSAVQDRRSLEEKQISPLPSIDHPNQQAGRGPRRCKITKQNEALSRTPHTLHSIGRRPAELQHRFPEAFFRDAAEQQRLLPAVELLTCLCRNA